MLWKTPTQYKFDHHRNAYTITIPGKHRQDDWKHKKNYVAIRFLQLAKQEK